MLSVRSAFQSPMSKALETIRVPGPHLLEQLGPEPLVQRRQQVQRDDRGLGEILLEEVALDELDPARVTPAVSALFLLSLIRTGSMSTQTPRGAVLLDRGDDDPAVAAAEVVDQVLGVDLRGGEHLAHLGGVGGNEVHVGLPGRGAAVSWPASVEGNDERQRERRRQEARVAQG